MQGGVTSMTCLFVVVSCVSVGYINRNLLMFRLSRRTLASVVLG